MTGWEKRTNSAGESWWEREHPTQRGVLERRYERVRASYATAYGYGANVRTRGELVDVGPVDFDDHEDETSDGRPDWWLGEWPGKERSGPTRVPLAGG